MGYIINSKDLQISLPAEKRLKIKRGIQKFKLLKRCKIRELSRLLGLLTSACPAIEYGWLYTKELERCKFLNLTDVYNYNSYMNIPSTLSSDFEWWYTRIDDAVNTFKNDDYNLEIFTDASTTGYGGACGEDTASGPWSISERQQHINYLQLLTAFFRT